VLTVLYGTGNLTSLSGALAIVSSVVLSVVIDFFIYNYQTKQYDERNKKCKDAVMKVCKL
jgi:predicted RND superfamily exporter protein